LHPKEKPSKGHFICDLCSEFIRPEHGEQAVNCQEKTYRTKRGKDRVYHTKAHHSCLYGDPTSHMASQCPIYPNFSTDKHGVCNRSQKCQPALTIPVHVKMAGAPCLNVISVPRRASLIAERFERAGTIRVTAQGGKKMTKKKSKKVEQAVKVPAEQTTPPEESEKQEPTAELPSAKTSAPTSEQVIEAMKTMESEVTSSMLRDHFKLDKESGRGQIRRVMKKLATDGKVEIVTLESKRKQFGYKLVQK